MNRRWDEPTDFERLVGRVTLRERWEAYWGALRWRLRRGPRR